MPVEQLRKLVERTGRSPRALERAAGVPEGRLIYWLRPSTRVTQIPPVSVLEEIADTLPGADLREVSRAFAAEVGLVLDDLTDDEFALVIAYRHLSAHDQHTLRTMATVMRPVTGRDQSLDAE